MICVDGNIGAGKSELINCLILKGHHAEFEPLEKWTLLDKFYRDPKKYAFHLQEQILNSYEPLQNSTFLERGPLSALHVFAKIAHSHTHITNDQYTELRKQCKGFKLPRAFIYLQLSSDKCVDRIAKRGRECEINITTEYLDVIEKYYEEFMIFLLLQGVPVLKIDVSNYDGKVEQLASFVEEFLKNLTI